jgi:hypothetical protein
MITAYVVSLVSSFLTPVYVLMFNWTLHLCEVYMGNIFT